MPATKSRKSASRSRKSASRTKSRSKTASRSRSSASRSRSRSCNLSRSRSLTGACGPRIPCVDANGYPLPYAVRGADGNCRIKPCRAGMIRNPATGGCVSKNGPTGKALVMAKKYEDAKKFQAAYEEAQRQTLDAEGNTLYKNSYSNMFNSEEMRNRRLARNQALVKEMNERKAQMASRSGIYGQTVADAAAHAKRTKTWGETFRGIFGQNTIPQPQF